MITTTTSEKPKTWLEHIDKDIIGEMGDKIHP